MGERSEIRENLPSIKVQSLKYLTFLVLSIAVIFSLIFAAITVRFFHFEGQIYKRQEFSANLQKIRELTVELDQLRINRSPSELQRGVLEEIIDRSSQLERETMSKSEQTILEAITKIIKNDENLAENQTPTPLQTTIFPYLKRLESVFADSHIKSTQEYLTQQNQFIWFSIVTFFISTLLLTLIARKWFERLSIPLIDISQVLNLKPSLDSDLALPAPLYREHFDLNNSLSQLWSELRESDFDKLKRIRVRNQQFKDIINSIGDIVFVIDEAGKLTHANFMFYEFFEIDPAERGEQLEHLQESCPEAFNLLAPIINAPEISEKEIHVRDQQKSFLARKRSIIDHEDNSYYGDLYMLEDISEEVMQQKLQKEFVAVLSHELKTPLQSLTTATELLGDFDEIKASPECAALSSTIAEDVVKIRAIANDFVRFSRSELSTLNINEKEVNLYEEVINILEPIRIILSDKRIKLKVENDDQERECHVQIDSIKFSWAISNIVLNAHRVSPENSCIEIKIQNMGQMATLSISDEGPGVSKDEEAMIFKPFFQGKKKGSLGLGLAIASEVIKAHGGDITYQRRDTGGSTFSIHLPMTGEDQKWLN